MAENLLHELRRMPPHRSRLNRMFGALAKHGTDVPHFSESIIDLMLDQPDLWEGRCPGAGHYLARFAKEKQRERMVHTAIDLAVDGVVASEQIVHLIKAAVSQRDRIASHRRGALARQLLQFARMSECIPVRGWTRRAAYELDPRHVQGQTIEAREFDDLHAFEQRWAIAYADPRRHHRWLEDQVENGAWPTTAEWRLGTGRVRLPLAA